MNQNVEKVLIIGLGMIGASIALASKSKGIKVIGFDSSKDSMQYAINNNIIDDFTDSIDQINSKEFCRDIDLIILSVPPKQTLDVLNKLKDVWNSDTSITLSLIHI